MSDIKSTVRKNFIDAAEQEDLFPEDFEATLAALQRKISLPQVFILEGLIIIRAERMCRPIPHVRGTFECQFGLEEVEDLPDSQFEDAVVYLAQLKGVN